MTRRFPWWLGALGGTFLLVAGGIVWASLHRPSPPTFAPTPGGAVPVGEDDGGRRVTLDARDGERWVRVELASGRISGDGSGPDWDLAARRFHVVANGGEPLPGDARVAPAGDRPMGALRAPPDTGWAATVEDGGELRHPVLEDWYRYDFFSHLLLARPRTYVLRGSNGRDWAVRFLSYYCPGMEAGCVTLVYAPLGDGGREPGGRTGRAPGAGTAG